MTQPVPVAFYAPMKSPDHPVPSGDRQIARLLMAALRTAGFAPHLVSALRTLDMAGSAKTQADLWAQAEAEIKRVTLALSAAPPALWFTYHCHHKAPDLLGPTVSRELGLPYAISEPSISPRRREGPWAAFARAAEEAIATADRLLWTTGRDREALEAAGHGGRMTHLPAFLDPGPAPAVRYREGPLRLLTVAMMRPGDKVESYRRIAHALHTLDGDWRLQVIGDGPARTEVEALFDPFGARVGFSGMIKDTELLRTEMEHADLFIWPGVGEGVGMVWLEAQAAGTPVVAEDHPAARELVAQRLATPDSPADLAALIRETAADLPRRGKSARDHIIRKHSLDSAADTLRTTLGKLVA